MADDKNGDISGSLDRITGAGQLARLKLYQEYITRISNNEKLKLAEKKHFDELDREFSDLSKAGEPKNEFSADEVIEKLGISERSLKWHTSRGNLKRNKDGTYPISTIGDFEKKYNRKKKTSAKGSSLMDQQERADLRYRIARARWQELNVKQLRGELISREEMAREWGKRLNTLFTGIRLWENRLSPRLEGKTRDEIMRIFKDETYLLMKTFAEKGRYCPEVDGAINLDDA